MAFVLSSDNVGQYLLNSNLCLESERPLMEVDSIDDGKNFNLVIAFPGDRKLLIKQDRQLSIKKPINELLREWKFHHLLKQYFASSQLISIVSEVLHFDPENSILVCSFLQEYQDVDKFYRKQRNFSTQIAAAIGWTVSTLHRTTLDSHQCQYFNWEKDDTKDNAWVRFPVYFQGLNRISPEILGSIPMDCLKFFSLYQRYESLNAAVTELINSSLCCCITHNDLKLSNMLLSHSWEQQALSDNQKSCIRLIDWERCDWGDPAFDLGTVVANYLLIWLDTLIVDPSITIEESLSLATVPLSSIRPSLVELIQSYLTHFPEVLTRYPGFVQRVVQYAGLFLLERILSTIDYNKYFGNQSICMLQVAKSLLCRPQSAIVTIFNCTEIELESIPVAA
jgi:hypothetical protein